MVDNEVPWAIAIISRGFVAMEARLPYGHWGCHDITEGIPQKPVSDFRR